MGVVDAAEPPPLPSGVLPRARALLPALGAEQGRVLRFLIEHPAETVRLPITELAPRAAVSTTTVVRAAQALGYAGLRELKLALAAETGAAGAAGPAAAVHEEVSPADDAATIARKVLRADAQAILDTLVVLDPTALERAVAALLGASRIECYGIASSAPVAFDAYYRLLRIGLPATLVADPHAQAVSAAQLPPGAVAFAVSHTGRTEETLNAARKAKGAGATVVVLTSHARTPLGALAEIELVTAARETAFRTEAVASRIAHLSVVDALYVACALRRGDAALAALAQANAIIAERRVR